MPKLTSRQTLAASRDKLIAQIKTAEYKVSEINKKIFIYDEAVDKAKFREGGVAYHKKLGNVIIAELLVNEKGVVSYSVINKTANTDTVAEEALIPHGPATDVLFNK
jgi:hypothetical protein